MLIFKLLFLTLCFSTSYCSEFFKMLELMLTTQAKDVGGIDVLGLAINQMYKVRPMDPISYAMMVQKEFGLNVTLIGSQNIYGPNGDLVEIRAIELHLPLVLIEKLFYSYKDPNPKDNDDDYENIQQLHSRLKKMLDIVTKIGFSVFAVNQEYNKDGKITDAAYFDQDLLYTFTEGTHFVNKTIEVNTSKIVDDHIKQLQIKGSPVAVHKFNSKGQFLSEESTLAPEYLVTVVNDDEVELELLEVAQKGLATVFLKNQNNKKEIPSELAEYLSLEYPKFDYLVFFNEPQSWYLNKKYKINLQVAFDHWESTESLIYCIIVQEREE